MKMSPEEWFDWCLKENPSEQLRSEEFPLGPACLRHLAPGINERGGPGWFIMEMQRLWHLEMRPPGSYSKPALQRKQAADHPICCKVGDERCKGIWESFPGINANLVEVAS